MVKITPAIAEAHAKYNYYIELWKNAKNVLRKHIKDFEKTNLYDIAKNSPSDARIIVNKHIAFLANTHSDIKYFKNEMMNARRNLRDLYLEAKEKEAENNTFDFLSSISRPEAMNMVIKLAAALNANPEKSNFDLKDYLNR